MFLKPTTAPFAGGVFNLLLKNFLKLNEMEKISFNPDVELKLQVSFVKGMDEMQKQKTIRKAAAFSLKKKWYEIKYSYLKITKNKGTIVFSKKECWNTEIGAPIILHSYFSDVKKCPSGAQKEGKIKWIGRDTHNLDVVTADCQSSYHDLQCCTFVESIAI